MKEEEQRFAELMAGVQAGAEEAARELVETHQNLLLWLVRKQLPGVLRRAFDSQDFVQVAWNSVFRHRSRLGRFERAEEFTAFLAAVVNHKVGMEVRRRLLLQKHNVNRERQLDSHGAVSAANDPTPSQVAIARERWSRLLESLPTHYRKMMYMRYLGHSTREIAQEMGMDEGSVRRIVRRIRDLIQ
jgi:RNA polymerase sigma factor (sigma-70 family)